MIRVALIAAGLWLLASPVVMAALARGLHHGHKLMHNDERRALDALARLHREDRP